MSRDASFDPSPMEKPLFPAMQRGFPPREPTDAMLDAGRAANENEIVDYVAIWRAMYDVAVKG